MPISEARKRANKKWDAENTKQVKLVVSNAEYGTLCIYCESKGIAKATMIRQAIREKMEREPIDQEQPGATP